MYAALHLRFCSVPHLLCHGTYLQLYNGYLPLIVDFGCGAVTTCFTDLSLLPPGFKPRTPACDPNALPLSHCGGLRLRSQDISVKQFTLLSLRGCKCKAAYTITQGRSFCSLIRRATLIQLPVTTSRLHVRGYWTYSNLPPVICILHCNSYNTN